MAIKSKDKIYFDSDCISSFLWTNTEGILVSLYGNRIVIPSLVYEELRKVDHIYNKLQNLISKGVVKTESFGFTTEEFKIYTLLKMGDTKHPKIGTGEASVIALAKCNEATMASNNLKDISYYLQYYKLNNITTADILYEALQNKLIIKAEAEQIWQNMRRKKRKLPYDTFEEWLKNKKTTN